MRIARVTPFMILELSGIGSRVILEKSGIPTIVDLPGVGEKLQDNSTVGVSFEASVFKQYQVDRSGPITNSIFCMAILPYARESSGLGDNDLEAILERFVNDMSIEPGLRKQCELIQCIVSDPALSSVQYLGAPVQLDKTQSAGYVPDEARQADYVTLSASLSHPFSRRTCHFTSSDTEEYPAVDPKYFTHPADVELLVRHLQYLSTIAATKPLADILKPNGRTIPVDLNLRNLNMSKTSSWGQDSQHNIRAAPATRRRENSRVSLMSGSKSTGSKCYEW